MIRLIARVKARGVRQPVLVRPDPEGGYEIIDGHRRYRASELAEYSEIPVIIRDLSDEEAVSEMVDGNVYRENVLPSERAWAYQEAVMATIPRNRLLAPRLRALVASFPGSLWKDGTHKERMEYAKTRLHYYRRRDTPAFYAALFLLTSSAELWKRSANCFYRKGFEPAYAVLGGISPHDYALISAAKGLYRGVGGPATMELADPDIVDAEVFRMIVNATLIARYGLPVLDIRARRARV